MPAGVSRPAVWHIDAVGAVHPISGVGRRRWRCHAHGRAVTPAPLHLLVDSTGLKLCGAGEWLVEKQGTKVRRSWRKLHIGLDADTGQIVAATLTKKEVDDGARAIAFGMLLT